LRVGIDWMASFFACVAAAARAACEELAGLQGPIECMVARGMETGPLTIPLSERASSMKGVPR
jgi:hypothetical protein